MKLKLVFALLLASIGVLMSCGEDPIIEPVDPEVQFDNDIASINDYLSEQGYDPESVDTTASGVRYIILEEGSGASISYADIVDNYYVGRFTDKEIFDTNIDTVDINNGTFDSLATYGPQRISHTETGWAIRGTYLNGYVDGVTAVYEQMNIGGKAEIIIPSSLAYGTGVATTSPFRDAVLVFEIYPTYKR